MPGVNPDIVPILKDSFEIDIPLYTSQEDLLTKLAAHINDLIQSDFQKLVTILYRVDVDEKRLKQVLAENPGKDAGEIIAGLLIERQMQKIQSRKQYKRDEDISDNEKW